MNRCTYRAQWSPGYGEYVGMWLEFPSRQLRAPTAHEAVEGIERGSEEAVAEIVACGGTPPASLTDRRYSGNFTARTSPDLPTRLVVEASEQCVSLNQWVVQKLAGAIR